MSEARTQRTINSHLDSLIRHSNAPLHPTSIDSIAGLWKQTLSNPAGLQKLPICTASPAEVLAPWREMSFYLKPIEKQWSDLLSSTNVIYSMWTHSHHGEKNLFFFALNSTPLSLPSSVIMLLCFLEANFSSELYVFFHFRFFSLSICLKTSLSSPLSNTHARTKHTFFSQHSKGKEKETMRIGKVLLPWKFFYYILFRQFTWCKNEKEREKIKTAEKEKKFEKTNKKFLRQNIKDSSLSWAHFSSLFDDVWLNSHKWITMISKHR